MLNAILEHSIVPSIKKCQSVSQLLTELHTLCDNNVFDYGLGMAFLSRNAQELGQYLTKVEPTMIIPFISSILALENRGNKLSNHGLWVFLGNLLNAVPRNVEMDIVLSRAPITENGVEAAKAVIEHFNIIWYNDDPLDSQEAMDFLVKRYQNGLAKHLPKPMWVHYRETDKWKALYKECFSIIENASDADWLTNEYEFIQAIQNEDQIRQLLESVTDMHPQNNEEMIWSWYAPLKRVDDNPSVEFSELTQQESILHLS